MSAPNPRRDGASADEAGAPGAVILVIEDELAIRRFLRAALSGAGYRVLESENAADGLREAATRSPDLVLLDLGLPDSDGLDVTRKLREWSAVPIVVVSARGREADKVAVLDAGADDYVTKPFGVAELLARVRVALRRRAAGDSGETLIEIGPLRIDRARRRVELESREVRLTPTEYRLLVALAEHPGRVLTHGQLMRAVWGPRHTQAPHAVRVYMAQLRGKLERDPSRPEILLTEPGVGYRTRDP